jgi:methanogenic corrinoid protein MtbC1
MKMGIEIVDVASALPGYLSALLAGEREAAVEAALQPVVAGADVLDVHLHVLQPALHLIGRQWELGEITVAAEHLATTITQFVVLKLYPWLSRPAHTRGRLLLTGVEGEYHQIGAHMVADALESDGWSVRFLGSNVPNGDVLHAVQTFRPQVLGVSCTLPGHLARVAALIAELRQAHGADAPRMLVGGLAFRGSEHEALAMGADAWAPDLRAAVLAARGLVAAPAQA